MKKLFTLISFVAFVICILPIANSSAQSTAWQWQNPLPQGNSLISTYFTDASIGYAVGVSGTILKTTNGGTNWTIQTSGTSNLLNSVYFTSPDTGYAVGVSGTILKTTNAGTGWTAQSSGTTFNLNSVYFTDTGYAFGTNGTILKTTNAGTNWTIQTSGTSNQLNSVYFTTPYTGYAVGDAGTILKTTNAGTNWTAQSSGTTNILRSVYFTSDDTGYAVGNAGTILKTTNNGTNWTTQSSGTTNILRSVYFTSDDTGYVVGNSGAILKTTNAGTNWTAQTSGTTLTLFSVYFATPDTGYAVGSSGKILKTTSGGANWAAQSKSSGTTEFLFSVYFIAPDTGYAVGWPGKILKTTSGGANWAAQASGTTQWLQSVYFTDVDTGYAVGDAGTILKTTNGGTNWTAQSSGTTNYLHSVYFTDANTGYAVGGNGTILKTTNNGTNWTAQTSGTTQNLESIYFTSPDTGYAVGLNGAIIKTTNSGTNWTIQTSGTSNLLNSVYFTSPDTGYAVGVSGTILKTTNAGTNWTIQTCGTSNQLNSVYFTDADTGYVVGAYEAILKTTTGGVFCNTALSTSQTNVSCFGLSNGSASVSAIGGTNPYSYKWSNGNTLQNVSSLTVGTYYITVTDANNCQADTVIVITEPAAAINISSSQINVSCFGEANGSAVVSAIGGTSPYSYKWSNGSTSQNITSLTTSTYYITVTDANGCKADTAIVITEPAELTVSSSQINVSCFGKNNGSASVSAIGGTSPYSYKWNNGDTSQNVTALTVGTYYVTVADANNCQADTVIVITEPAELTISSSQINVSCFGGYNGSATVSAIGGTSTYSYKWSNGSTSQNVTSLSAGTYYITVTDANSCKSGSVIVITQPNPIAIVLSKTEADCDGINNGTASVSAYGGVPGYSYLWSTGSTTSSINGLSVGNYTVQVTDSANCKKSKFFHIFCDLVWPGDINGDLRADHYDLLSLGMIYGLTGTPRDSVDIKFEGKESLDWPGFFNSGINKKHADCNGDGLVNKADRYAIKKNFGKAHGKTSSVTKIYNSINPDLYFEILTPDVAPGTDVEVKIMAGKDSVSLYGIGFEIKIDKNLIDSSTLQLTWTNSWLGTEDVDMLTLDTVDVSNGEIFAACVRTDFNTNRAYGEIARMKFKIKSDTTLTDTTKINMSITSEEGGISTSEGDSVVFNDAQDTLVINPTSIRENVFMQPSFSIYPNPTDGTIQLQFGKTVNIETITVYNELGQVVYEENKKLAYKNNYKLQLPELENGIYSIRIKTTDYIYLNRFTYLKK